MDEGTKSIAPSAVFKPSTYLESSRSPSPVQNDAENRSQFSMWRKYTILFIVSWMTLAVTYSSTSLLAATNEIASEFSTTTEILDITNAGVLIAMGSSSFIWGPISEIVGRRNAYNTAIGVLFLCSLGTALARDMATFTAMRVLGGSVGTFFMVSGQTIIADVFEPVSLIGVFMFVYEWRRISRLRLG
jgi:MFS family permease